MKNKILAYLLLMMPALLATSCLKDQDNLFDKSASLRVSEYLSNTKRVLTSSEHGWALDFFPDRKQSYGGYSYTLKFTDQTVEVCSEISNNLTYTETSTYSLDNEDGPVIAFDTYNNIFHFFSTPGSGSGAGGYEAYDGDFIFIIMDISDDENTITLKGNRSGNILYMHRISESIVDYQLRLRNFANNLVFDLATAEIDGQKYVVNILADDRIIVIGKPGSGEEDIEVPFCFDSDGISLYKPVTVGGKEVRVFKYDEPNGAFVSQEDNSVVFYGQLNPSIVINNIGDKITSGNAAAELKYTFNLADRFTYTPTADWINVKAEGNSLTISLTANTTGTPRSGAIEVAGNGEKAMISVTQIEVADLLGNYTVNGLDSDKQAVADPATITTNGAFYTLTIHYGSYPQTVKMLWNADEGRFEIPSAQATGTIGQYSIWLTFLNNASGTWTAANTGYTAYLVPTIASDGKVNLLLGGSFGTYNIDCLGFGTTISGANYFYDYYADPVFIKK